MDIAAIPAIARVAAPYPARVPLIDETRPAWATPRAAEAAESPPAPQPARSRDQAPPAPIAGMAPRPDPDLLRDQYAEARMRRAIADYAAAPAEAAARANDWGTIEGLAPLQPYRLAMGNPQVQEWQAAAAAKAMGAAVPKVASIGATENATDQARYRPGFAPQPWS